MILKAALYHIEGILTFLVAVTSYWFVHDFPEDAKFLSEEERSRVLTRLRIDQGASGSAGFKWAHIRAAFLDWKTYAFA